MPPLAPATTQDQQPETPRAEKPTKGAVDTESGHEGGAQGGPGEAAEGSVVAAEAAGLIYVVIRDGHQAAAPPPPLRAEAAGAGAI